MHGRLVFSGLFCRNHIIVGDNLPQENLPLYYQCLTFHLHLAWAAACQGEQVFLELAYLPLGHLKLS